MNMNSGHIALKDKLINLISGHLQMASKSSSQLLPLMKSSKDLLTKLDLPTNKQEEWKYLNILHHLNENCNLSVLQTSFTAAPLQKLSQLGPILFCFIDGQYRPEFSSNTQSVRAFYLSAFDSAQKVKDESLQFQTEEDDFVDQLNMSCMSGTLIIEIQNELKSPLAIVNIISENAQGHLLSPRVCIRLGKQASCSILEYTQFQGLSHPSYTHNTVTDLQLDDGAHVEHVYFQNGSKQALHLHKISAQINKDASLKSYSVSKSAKLFRLKAQINLAKPGANTNLHGLYLCNEERQGDISLHVDHQAPHTSGHHLFKGILDDNAKGSFTGKVIVRKNSQQVDSSQLNHILLLSKKAKAHTRPQLEVYADDVKCTHGASIGQLDEEQLFYLMSRGLNKDQALKALYNGFVFDIVDKISHQAIKSLIFKLLSGDQE